MSKEYRDAQQEFFNGLRAADPTVNVVQPPMTMPWGNRSALLRDPDGGLVNLFAPPLDGRRTPDSA